MNPTERAIEAVKKQARRDVRSEFLRLLVEDSETEDRRRRGFNQAIFAPAERGGYAIFNGTDLGMVMEKFDRAVKNLEQEWTPVVHVQR